MRTEPIDLRLPRRLAATPATDRTSTAIDGAFAALTEADLRLDQGDPAENTATSPEPEVEPRSVSPKLIASLRGQLEAIEAQQSTLQRLLDGLER